MMVSKHFFSLLVTVLALGVQCSSPVQPNTKWKNIPFPEDNPLTEAKIAFGKELFFDKRLSAGNQISCASCHQPEKAFTDGLTKSRGVDGRMAMRNAPSIFNSAYFKSYMYDGEVKTLEEQVLVPLQDHREMAGSMKEIIRKLAGDKTYQKQAHIIFNRDLDAYVITRAISSYERSLVSRNSRFDQYQSGKKDVLKANELAGWKLFSEKLYCVKCHSGIDFTNYSVVSNGLYTSYGSDQGRYRINGLEQERGTFKVPGLRNVSLTAPYMHDGSIQTLREVILHYASGGKNFPNKSTVIKPFLLTESEISQLESFFKSLTDTSSYQAD
ncbi:cytochrome c peroxidase [Fluviicola sp.]|jgi:cytochrome c peroxidase|uniref:cytochrome-c peroxidase n=1 Tax=Fluviicola sp. TaxID=1917219 RepID=UPI00282269EA|nr:cytochrome c peroxidase [Fluviicola sp.]MDR0802609.1 cytochrome-c peroxidase [Fluviicola sp.]